MMGTHSSMILLLITIIDFNMAAPYSSSPLFQEDNSSSKISPSQYKGVFWQITDIHWDQQYSINGDEKKMCHKEYSSSGRSNGKFGNYLCDSPWPLVKNAIQTMQKIESTPDFVLWTGDNVPHVNDPEPDFSTIFLTLNNITTELRTSFEDYIPILPVLGNHDAFPKDDYPVAGEEFYGQYLTKGGWSLVLPEEAQEDFKKGGFYEYSLPSNVTVMVLNTNLYYGPNDLLLNISDPCGQFSWIREKLIIAAEEGRKVVIAAHAPPGYFERYAVVPFFSVSYNDVYLDLLNEFEEVIMAQIYGHEHTDSFKLFTSATGEVKSVGFLAPSVTPWYPAPVLGGTPVNPSLRLYSYNSSTLLDYSQFHLNLAKTYKLPSSLSKIGRGLTNEPEWEEFYRARKMFGLESLDPNSMAKLYQNLVNNDELFQTYYLLNSAGYNHGKCVGCCKRTQLCAIANIRIEDLNRCMNDNDTNRCHNFNNSFYLDHVHLNVNSDLAPPSSAPIFVVILVTLGMSLMVILTVSLGIMVVNVVIGRHRLVRQEGGMQVSDLNFSLRPKGYHPF
ncbi:acid sphingomyelinase-like phosphodiesterase 3b [Palaemon carinicauda]|uniref:acid sphingomyelinase-like phosphodiesterase 3b n=1 Tax=Palaemon carinicauda TaxID=392227 RepID=UPI0035B60CC2